MKEAVETKIENREIEQGAGAEALEKQVAKTTIKRENPAVVEEKKTGLMGKITGYFAERKLKNFKESTSMRMKSFLGKGYKLPAGGEEEIFSNAKADGYQGNIGIDQKNNTIRYIPTAEITYSGNENSKAGPTAGA